MAGREYVVMIDDEDREDAPETPWTATLYTVTAGVSEQESVAVGIGATVPDALRDLAGDLELAMQREARRGNHMPGGRPTEESGPVCEDCGRGRDEVDIIGRDRHHGDLLCDECADRRDDDNQTTDNQED